MKIADKGAKVKARLNESLLQALDGGRPPSCVVDTGMAIINGSAILKTDPDPEPEIPFLNTLIGSRICLESVHFRGEYVHQEVNHKDRKRSWVLTYHDGRPSNYLSEWYVEAVKGFNTQIRLHEGMSGANCNYLYVSDLQHGSPLVWHGSPNEDILSKSRFELEVGK